MAGGSVFCQNGPTRRSLPRSVGGACRHLFEREDSSATDDEYGWQRVPQREQETGSLNTEIGVPRDLLDQVVAYFHPRRAIMFGSRARGKAEPDSDVDLLVVLDDDAPLEKRTLRAGCESRQNYHQAADIIPVRDSALQARVRAIGSFAHIILRDEVTVYERQ
jgi:Nucleotidyltransferase domain